MQRISDLMDIPPITRKREGAKGQFNDVINLKSAHFGALSNAQTVKKGKGKGKGNTRLSEGMASSSKKASDYIHNVKVQIDMVKCHHCQAENLEGTHKCQSCFKWLIAWTDGRIATEVCRLESTAKKINGLFSLDRIDFEKQPRAQRVGDRVKADQRRAGRSNYGNVRDAATTHAGRYAKLGYMSILDRMERDPYYLFNNAMGQITPDCCEFLERVAKCIAPDFGRTRNEREQQLGTGVSTRMVFMPDESRDIQQPLDVTKEAFVAHYARFFTLPQFAVLWAEILRAKGEPSPLLAGWAGRQLVIDHSSAQDCFIDLVHFAKQQWNEQYHTIKGDRYTTEEEATASDVAEFPLARQREYTQGRQGLRREFDPVARPEKGKGKGKGKGLAWQRPVFERAIECWNCGQYGHRSFECPNGWEPRYDNWRSYERRPGGQASWRNTGGSYQSYGGWSDRRDDPWGRDWTQNTSSSASSSMRPPEPERPPSHRVVEVADDPAPEVTESSQPEGAATDDAPMDPPEAEAGKGSGGGRRRRVVREEYVEIDGAAHSKVIYNDGTFYYYPW